MFYFMKKKREGNLFDCSDITFKVDSVVLEDLLEEFESFLKACGFILKGRLDIFEEGE